LYIIQNILYQLLGFGFSYFPPTFQLMSCLGAVMLHIQKVDCSDDPKKTQKKVPTDYLSDSLKAPEGAESNMGAM